MLLLPRAGDSDELRQKIQRLNSLLGEQRKGELLPLSTGQQRIWLMDQIRPQAPLHTVSHLLHIRGPLDIAALRSAIADTVARHEVLRTRYPTIGGYPVQLVLPGPEHRWEQRRVPPSGQDTAEKVIREAARERFDLQRGPLFRTLLVDSGEQESLLLLSMHHSITDGWSTGLLIRDLLLLYARHAHGRRTEMPEAAPYRDFITWEQTHATSASFREGMEYWQDRLAGPQAPGAPFGERSSAQTAGDVVQFTVKTAARLQLDEFCRRTRSTSFMALLTAFLILLGRYVSETDLVVGTPVSNRRADEFQETVGYFSNTVALRNDLSGTPTFRELLSGVRETVLGALTHDDVPFSDVVKALRPERSPSGNPLFQVAFVLQPHRDEVSLPDLGIRTSPVPNGTAAYDLLLDLTKTRGTMLAEFTYSTDLFQRETVVRMADEFNRILSECLARPDDPISRPEAAVGSPTPEVQQEDAHG